MSKISPRTPSPEGFQITSVVKGLSWALVITIFLGITISLLLQFTSLSETLLQNFSAFIFFISMFFGATVGARSAGSKGLLHGLCVSALYLVLVLLTGLIWSPETFTFAGLLKRTGFAVLAGILGGFTGIGLAAK
ncbi:MAG: TIGR04086 family membrane protein [Peptococcaceae bacterium]|jgi:putative membrane protein (TIGR04086 family)|nr:TIGR04086 family membrane protein [Peptococcaceae bacterium]MDH7525713.1 TIGR04086 family membrane protein [Peptococcaceae bacterium]